MPVQWMDFTHSSWNIMGWMIVETDALVVLRKGNLDQD